MKNMTNIHKKLDRILEKLSGIDETRNTAREIARSNRYLSQLVGEVGRMAKDTNAMLARSLDIQATITSIMHDVATMANEARKEAKEARERITDLAVSTRRN